MIELSVALVIIGLLVGGAISGFTAFQKNRLMAEAQSDLKEIKSALIGYLLANGRLPCADNDSPGDEGYGEETGGGDCEVGWLPHRELGVRNARDPWGRRYLYRVDEVFTDTDQTSGACPPPPASASFTLCDTGEIEVHDAGDCVGPPVCNILAQGLPVIFLSMGANGVDTTSVDELENQHGEISSDSEDAVFVAKQYSEKPGYEFDDQVLWISVGEVKTEMVRAGRLP